MTAAAGLGYALGLVAMASGWLMWRGTLARASGVVLVVSGVLVLLAAGLETIDEPSARVTVLASQVAFPIAFVLYPRVMRPWVTASLVTAVAGAGALALTWSETAGNAGFVVGVLMIAHAWWTFETGTRPDKRAMAWAALSWGAVGLATAMFGFAGEAWGLADVGASVAPVGIALSMAGPVAMAVGAARPEWVDVRALVTRAVVASVVVTLLFAVTTGVAAVMELVADEPPTVTVVALVGAVVAFAARPLADQLRSVVDTLLFGERPDPLAAATSVADLIGDDVSASLDAVRAALVLPFAELTLDGDVLAVSGERVPHTRSVPIRLTEGAIGSLVVGLRAGDLDLTDGDRSVLRIVAPLLGQTLRSQALVHQLADSRGRLVVAVEDERRRLHRDLHDGLGPTLTGVAFAADAAGNRLRTSPDAAAELLAGLRSDTASAIAEVRRLVEGLRPPAIDELGLVGAVRAWSTRLHTSAGEPLAVVVRAPAEIPELAAASEVAAYRIVIEALTNVARHSGSPRAEVDVDRDGGGLRITVTDWGRGLDGSEAGVGMSSIRDRVTEVGGRVEFESSDVGTRVVAHVPAGM